MWSPSVIVSVFRFILIFGLMAVNVVGLIRWWERPGDKKRKHININRLSLICTLIVNLFYVSVVWAPFTLRAFNHYVLSTHNHYFQPPQHSINIENMTAYQHTPPQAIAVEHHGDITTLGEMSDDLSASQGHQGSWKLVYPGKVERANREVDVDRMNNIETEVYFPSYINIDCFLQDVVTSAAIYSLAYISVLKLILNRKPIYLPNTCVNLFKYLFLMTVVPIVATFVIRYSNTIRIAQKHHRPEELSCGITMYNIICDIHLDDNFLLVSFIEWAGVLVLFLLTISVVLKLANIQPVDVKSCPNDSSSGTAWITDYPVFIAAMWAWPLKLAVLVIFYVSFGRIWTNTLSWISHLIVSTSTIFLLMSAFLSSEAYDNEKEHLKDQKDHLKDQNNKSKGKNNVFSNIVILGAKGNKLDHVDDKLCNLQNLNRNSQMNNYRNPNPRKSQSNGVPNYPPYLADNFGNQYATTAAGLIKTATSQSPGLETFENQDALQNHGGLKPGSTPKPEHSSRNMGIKTSGLTYVQLPEEKDPLPTTSAFNIRNKISRYANSIATAFAKPILPNRSDDKMILASNGQDSLHSTSDV